MLWMCAGVFRGESKLSDPDGTGRHAVLEQPGPLRGQALDSLRKLVDALQDASANKGCGAASELRGVMVTRDCPAGEAGTYRWCCPEHERLILQWNAGRGAPDAEEWRLFVDEAHTVADEAGRRTWVDQ